MSTSPGQFRQKTQKWDCASVDDCFPVFGFQAIVLCNVKTLCVCLKPQTVKQLFTN